MQIVSNPTDCVGASHCWTVQPHGDKLRERCVLCGLLRVTGVIVTYWRSARRLVGALDD